MIFSRESRPADFKSTLEVSACFLEHQGEVLFVLRAPGEIQGGTWAIPGGRVRSGETPEQACVREVFEESGLQIEKPQFVKTVYIRYPEYDYTYHIFRKPVVSKDQPMTLHKEKTTDWAWFNRSTVNQLESQKKLILDEMPCIQEVYGAADFGI